MHLGQQCYLPGWADRLRYWCLVGSRTSPVNRYLSTVVCFLRLSVSRPAMSSRKREKLPKEILLSYDWSISVPPASLHLTSRRDQYFHTCSCDPVTPLCTYRTCRLSTHNTKITHLSSKTYELTSPEERETKPRYCCCFVDLRLRRSWL
jgi:hypothetical protein